VVSGLRYTGVMVDAIIRITTLLVAVVAIVNLAQVVLIGARLARRVRQQQPDRWLQLWLPAWRSPREAFAWLTSWRAILTSGDPLIAAIRSDGRTLMVRHAQLFAWAETWAMLVVLMAPYAA
jgi:hypothetical protein